MKPITLYSFPTNQYYRTETTKSQIYLHHTAGNPNPFAVYDYWASNAEHVATCIVIGGKPTNTRSNWIDGQIIQGFSSKYWAYHLGLKQATFDALNIRYQVLDRNSIGIELCNWGQLTLGKDGQFRTYVNSVVPESEVVELKQPYRGHKYFHAYTDAQIESVYDLLVFWNDRYGIPIKYNLDIWDICPRALMGTPGVYTHCSVRSDKIDISPQPKIISMLNSL